MIYDELFCESISRGLDVIIFAKEAPSLMFDMVPNMPFI